MSGPYRATEESADREGHALRELGERRTRLRLRVLAVSLTLGFAFGLPGYALVREAQLAASGMAWVQISAAVGILLPVVAAGAFGLWVAKRLIRGRMDAWLAEVCARHRVTRARLEEIIALVDAIES